MSEIFEKLRTLMDAAVKSEAAEQAKAMTVTVLTKVQQQINDALDSAIQSLTAVTKEQQKPIKVTVEKGKEPLKAPGRIIEWFAQLPHDKSSFYINLYREGKVQLLENGTIDGPDFYIKPNTFRIISKRKMSSGITRIHTDKRYDEIYIEEQDIPLDINPAHIYQCRVTIPKANMRDDNFPVLYIIAADDDKNAVRATYRDYIINSGKYNSAMLAHATNPKNIRGTNWYLNIAVCSMNRKPRVA